MLTIITDDLVFAYGFQCGELGDEWPKSVVLRVTTHSTLSCISSTFHIIHFKYCAIMFFLVDIQYTHCLHILLPEVDSSVYITEVVKEHANAIYIITSL